MTAPPDHTPANPTASNPTASNATAAGAPGTAHPAPRACYVHVPFCARRCGYCNFTLVARRGDLIEPYLAAVAHELAPLGPSRPLDTLFLGGGTPTQLSPAQFERLLDTLAGVFALQPGYEFSVEANPADITAELAALLARRGVNRVSLGSQSLDDAKLAALERDHQADDVRRAVEHLRRQMPSASLSLDLIFAAPGETLAGWQADLEAALDLAPDHISTYGLTFEKGTTFWGRRQRAQLASADEELERAMYLAAIQQLTAAGFEHYEVSNFARPAHRCRHNEVYWNADEYFAAGPGAARYVGGRREVNHRSTSTYLRRITAGRSPVAESETLSPEDRAREALVIGLRRLAGIERAAFERRFGWDPPALGGAHLERFCREGLLVLEPNRLRLSPAGLLVSDALWPWLLRP